VGPRPIVVGFGLILVGLGAGGGDSEPRRGDSSDNMTRRSPPKKPGRVVDRPQGHAPAGEANHASAHRKRQTLPNGTVLYTRPPPAGQSTVVAGRCAISRIRKMNGQHQRVDVPPAPGIRARRQDDQVVVTVDPGKPPLNCRADFIRVLVDDSDDAYPPLTKSIRLNGSSSRRIAIELLPQIRDADSAQAVAGTERGRTGPAARVRIRQ